MTTPPAPQAPQDPRAPQDRQTPQDRQAPQATSAELPEVPAQLTVAPPPLMVQGQPGWLVPARAVGLLLALVMIGSGALSVTAQFVTTQGSETRTFSQPIDRIRIVADTGDVRVRVGSAGTQTTVRTVQHFSFGTPVITSALAGRTLELGHRCDQRRWRILPGNCSVDFEVTAPDGVAVDVKANTGDVRVLGARSDVAVESDTGDVAVLDADSDRVTVSGATGDIRVTFVTAPQKVVLSTDIGDIRVRVPADENTYLVRARTDIGDTRVDEALRNGRSSRTIQATTATGDVTVTAG